MDSFCQDAFWDSNLTWGNHRDYPEFTECFQDVALPLVTNGWLILSAPIYVYTILHFKTEPLPRSWKSLSKTSIAVLQLSIKYLEMKIVTSTLDDRGKSFWNSRFVGLLCEVATLVLVMGYIELERRQRFVTSGVLTIYWFLACISGLVLFYSRLVKNVTNLSATDLTIVKIHVGLSFVQLTISCIPESLPEQMGKQDCPLQRSSFLSRCTFSWINSILKTGYERQFTDDDLPRVMPTEQSVNATAHFESRWQRQKDIERAKLIKHGREKDKLHVPLLKVLVRSYGFMVLMINLLKVISAVFMFGQPFILGYLIGFAEDKTQPIWKEYVYLLGFVTCLFGHSLTNNYMDHLCVSVAFRLRPSLTDAIFKKAMKMTNRARAESSIGEMVNLLSTDMEYIKHWFTFCWSVWTHPAQVIASFILLYNVVGIAVLSGVAVILVIMPLNAYITKVEHKRHRERIAIKDDRIKLMTEVLHGIKILKLYAWEMAFGERINEFRTKELSNLLKQLLFRIVLQLAWNMTPFLIALTTFVTYVNIDGNSVLDAKTAFSAIALFGIMNHSFKAMPETISHILKAIVSLKRVDKFLNNDDIDRDNITSHHSCNAISINDGTFVWDTKLGPSLKQINFTVPKGSLVAIVGTVGSGKSSLLSAILGDMEKEEGMVNVDGSCAYVPQQAWIYNETVENNITFGNEFEHGLYTDVVDACQLTSDFEMLPGKDQTEIGEKGINLSGGQKQRVSMARAVYYNADIYLLDDPLSAVDAHVGKHIFDNVIGEKGLLRNKTRVLVTHGITWLPNVDTIVVMDKGTISEVGSYKELMLSKGAFAKFMQEYSQEYEEDRLLEAQCIPDVEKDFEFLDDNRLDDEIGDDSTIIAYQRLLADSSFDTNSSLLQQEGCRSRNKTRNKDKEISLRRTISQTLHDERDKFKDKTGEDYIRRILENADKGKIIEEEKTEEGHVKWNNVATYCQAVGRVSSTLIVIFFVTCKLCRVGQDVWLKEWTSSKGDADNLTLHADNTNHKSRNVYYVGMYALFGFIDAILLLCKQLIMAFGVVKAAKILHERMLFNVLRCPISFFDTTPVGRVTNRFSQDIEKIDEHISGQFELFFGGVLDILAIIAVILYTVPVFILVIIPIGFLYFKTKAYSIPTKLQLSRLESKKRSPIFAHFGECMNGTSVIRAYKRESMFTTLAAKKVDAFQEALFMQRVLGRWIATRLEMMTIACFCVIAMFTTAGRDHLNSAVIGLVFQYALKVTDSLQCFIRSFTELEHTFVAMERITEYSSKTTEAPLHTIVKPTKDWPRDGNVEISNYSVRYRDGLDLVLKDIDMSVKPGEKIGIVGRTGAGKSSLALGLFRLIEPAIGCIHIDGHSISKLGLFDLRSNLTILPQEPVLFSGTLRMNIDPLDTHSDEAIYKALEHSHLGSFISSLPERLNYECGEGGQNLSVGQRQLICLARSLLRRSKVLILDEATAAVDMKTDELIQKTIKTEFKECTVITIAHRLNTILDYDRILVLHQGEVKEFDKPRTLLDDADSVFYSMAKDAGLVTE